MTLAVYFIVFQFFLKNGIPNFVIFLFSGLLVWNLFQTGVHTGTGVVVNNAGLVKKVAFPREILALASVGSAVGVLLVPVARDGHLHGGPALVPAWSYLGCCRWRWSPRGVGLGPGRVPLGRQRLPA